MKKKIGDETKLIYYISDIHFKDEYIFKICKRPFRNIEEMEETIINNWNKKVKHEDDVYVLGDIGITNDISSVRIYMKLKGHKHLLVGNHDQNILKRIRSLNIFDSIGFIDLIVDNNRSVCVCHYPLMDWIDKNRKSFLVYGHIHNKTDKEGKEYGMIKKYYSQLPAYNCGVDVCNFEPCTLDELIKLKEENRDEPYIN